MVVAAAKAGLWREDLEKRLPRVAEVPFDSDRKRMSTIHRLDGQDRERSDGAEYIAYVKGAPDVMLPLCDTLLEDGVDVELTPGRRQHIENTIRDLGREGLRPDLVRIGASTMLGDIERQLEHHRTGRYADASRHALA